jgi:hypothetical protein
MDLFDPIGKMRDRGIDVNNHSKAVTQAEDTELSQEGYELAVFEITGRYYHTGFEGQAKMYYINIVDQLTRQYVGAVDGDDGEAITCIDTSAAIATAQTRVMEYFQLFRSKIPTGSSVKWRLASYGFTQELKEKHAAEYTRPPSKQARGVELVRANPGLSNRELQVMFREQLGLSVNGAATYVYNVRRILAKESESVV